jgi:hypothetical protein
VDTNKACANDGNNSEQSNMNSVWSFRHIILQHPTETTHASKHPRCVTNTKQDTLGIEVFHEHQTHTTADAHDCLSCEHEGACVCVCARACVCVLREKVCARARCARMCVCCMPP